MKSALLLIFMFTSISTVGQTYYSFPTANAKWIFNYSWYRFESGTDNENYTLEIIGDTLIDVTTYHKLMLTSSQYVSTGGSIQTVSQYQGAIREDLPNKKVYYIEQGSATEELLYDFNLEVGDPVLGRLENLETPDLIETIDYVYVGNSYRKRWNINSYYRISIIEGIGSTYGLIRSSPGNGADQPNYSLVCFKQDADYYPNTLAECEFTTGITHEDGTKENISIFPNPSNGSFTIAFERIPIKEVRLTDLLGNIVFQKPTDGLDHIDISGLKEAFYILTLTDFDENLSVSKIVNCP